MASKRMFDKSIIDTDRFTDMPMSTKALYFILGMEADDHGFVSPKRVIRMHGASDDDIKILIAKGFVIPFESGVVVITDWHRHNYLDKNRIKQTEYSFELSLLDIQDRRYYLTDVKQTLNECSTSIEEYRVVEKSIEENIKTISSELSAKADPPSNKDVVQGTEPAKQAVITLPLNDKTEYPIYQEQIQQWAELYPAVDVIQQFRGMKGWILANPQKRKTKRGINGFINRWLSREQDKGGAMVERDVNNGAYSQRTNMNSKENTGYGKVNTPNNIKNKFVNYDQPDRDYDELERLAQERLLKDLNNPNDE